MPLQLQHIGLNMLMVTVLSAAMIAFVVLIKKFPAFFRKRVALTNVIWYTLVGAFAVIPISMAHNLVYAHPMQYGQGYVAGFLFTLTLSVMLTIQIFFRERKGLDFLFVPAWAIGYIAHYAWMVRHLN